MNNEERFMTVSISWVMIFILMVILAELQNENWAFVLFPYMFTMFLIKVKRIENWLFRYERIFPNGNEFKIKINEWEDK